MENRRKYQFDVKKTGGTGLDQTLPKPGTGACRCTTKTAF
jgi:hypothetical protein